MKVDRREDGFMCVTCSSLLLLKLHSAHSFDKTEAALCLTHESITVAPSLTLIPRQE